jgi:large subunit ribosomal protein L35
MCAGNRRIDVFVGKLQYDLPQKQQRKLLLISESRHPRAAHCCHLQSSKNGAVLKGQMSVMPKMKTKSSAKKRFRVRPGGTVKRGQAFKRHILTKKTTKNKRQLRGAVGVHETNLSSVRAMLPFA